MTADPRLLPAGIAADSRSLAMLELMQRQVDLDLTPILTQRVDSTAAAALIHLAWQYHVLGLEGFDLATTDEARRSLLRSAVELHRYKGTPWAVKTSLSRVGYQSVAIDETVAQRRYNGRFKYDAEITYGGEGAGWAAFGVVIQDLADDHEVTADEVTLLTAIINQFKNARSRLQQLAFDQQADEVLDPLDETATLSTYAFPFADGSYSADGSITAGGVLSGVEVLP